MAAAGALRAGAGYVSVAVPGPSLSIVETKLTAQVKVALPLEKDGGLGAEAVERLMDMADRADAFVIGPGIGRAASTAESVRVILRELDRPILLDADGLWALGANLEILRERTASIVLTPHSGEAARLLGISSEMVDADRPSAVRAIAGGPVVCVLKGARTLVSDGERVVVNMTGNPGLATLGTGDVLSGITGTFLSQGLGPLEAGALGSYVHGAAGDSAASALTPICCTAEDVITYLPDALRRLLDSGRVSEYERDME